MKKNTSAVQSIVCLLSAVFCLFATSGCVSFPTVDVKGTALASGFYTGLRTQYTDLKQTEDYDLGLYADAGIVSKSGEDGFNPEDTFYEISGSYPFDEEDMYRVGVSGGLAVIWGGVNYYANQTDSIQEAYISATAGVTLSVSRFWGDTQRPWSADVLGTVDLPILPGWFLFGTRYSWYEGAKASSALMGYLWRGYEGSFELELGAMIDNGSWFATTGFETDDRYALAMRWVFF